MPVLRCGFPSLLIDRRVVRAGAAGGAPRLAAGVLVQAPRGRDPAGRLAAGTAGGAGPRHLGHRDVVSADRQRPRAAALPRQGDDCARVARGDAAGLGIATIAHQERRELLDRLAVLRNQVFMLDHMYMSLFGTFGWILRLGVTIALLMSIHPGACAAGRVCRAAGVHVSLAAGHRAAGVRAWRLAHPPGAPSVRDRETAAGPGKEVRVTGIGARLAADRRSCMGIWKSARSPPHAWESAAWHTLAWTIFGLGLCRRDRVRRLGPPGDGRRRAPDSCLYSC